MRKTAPLLKPLNKTKLYEEIVEQLKNRIINRNIAPGEKLPAERTLAQMLNVNRSTVREALGKLESMDLVEIRHGEGVYVKNFLESGSLELVKALLFKNNALDMDVFKNLMDLREVLVPEMAYCAAQNRSEKDLKNLEHLVSDTNEKSMGDRDMRLHNIIARASGNVLYVILLNAFTSQMDDYCELYFSDPENRAKTIIFHKDIYQAIKNREPDKAKQVMKDILRSAGEKVLDMLA
ncbi:MAG: FadR family transcriptional regulator [Desulfobacteraceae bacterium]|nr:FadR family transcriptional regulator [Desulfobacteraceae bacterium]MBC2755461.1 FadR family transcriptional regulator [Desulfobacteraceae bacterium]